MILTSTVWANIRVATSDWQDFSHHDGSGIYQLLLKRVYPDEEITFIVTPFAKSKYNFEHKNADILVGIYPEDITNRILPKWPLDQEAPVVAFFDTRYTKLKAVADLDNASVAWLRGYDFDNVVPHKTPPYLVDDVLAGFKLLEKGRIDAYIDYPYNHEKSRFKYLQHIEVMPQRKIYVAFQNNQQGKKLAAQFDQQMAILYQSGDLKTLFGDYYATAGFDQHIQPQHHVTVYTDEHNLLNTADADRLDQHTALYDVTTQLTEFLPEYQFNFSTLTNLSKILDRKSDNINCLLNAVKTAEREQKYTISKPLMLYQGPRLYSTKKLSESSYLDIVQLMKANNELKLGLSSDRHYSDTIDQLIANIDDQQIVESSLSELRTIKQLQKGRFDLLIELPTIFNRFWQRQFPTQKVYQYQLLKTPDYSYGHLVCNNNDNAKQFIHAVNNALSKQYTTGLFYLAQRQLLQGESKENSLRAFNQTFK